jgi:hypothetical protein
VEFQLSALLLQKYEIASKIHTVRANVNHQKALTLINQIVQVNQRCLENLQVSPYPSNKDHENNRQTKRQIQIFHQN